MAPKVTLPLSYLGSQSIRVIARQQDATSLETGDWRAAADQYPEDLILESWSEGFMVGALIIMACVTIANMRKRVLLHKLVLLEQVLAMAHGTFCFMDFKGYGWYLSSTAFLLYCSWVVHNVVAWMKVRPFFRQPGGFFKPKVGLWTQRIYLGTFALTLAPIAFEASNNFRFFNNRGGYYKATRPYEPLMRDPWWVFTCLALFHVVRKSYGAGVVGLIKSSPRFGILIMAIFLAIGFTILDIVDSIHEFVGRTDGINPFWKLSLVFKCLTDTIMLDDFRTELNRLNVKRMRVEEAKRNSIALVTGFDEDDSNPPMPPRRDTARNQSVVSPLSSPIKMPNGDFVRTRKYGRVNPSPELSDSTTLGGSDSQHSRRSVSDPNAELEEVEFSTALSTDPRRLSGVDGGRRDSRSHARQHIGNTTRKLSRLPGLRDFKFEAIKPGRRASRDDSSEDMERSPTNVSSSSREPGVRNIHDEILRNTIMDLKAEKKAKAARERQEDNQDIDLESGRPQRSQPSADPLDDLSDLDVGETVD